MTNRTTFTSVVDGDQLSQGYFNEIYAGIGSLGHLVAYDLSASTITDSGYVTVKTHSLSADQTNFDILVITVRGKTEAAGSSGATRIRVDPPLTSAETVVGMESADSATSYRNLPLTGHKIMVAGTDFTKGSAASFVVDAGGYASGSATYTSSYIVGYRTSGG